jgi:hypothetical protein
MISNASPNLEMNVFKFGRPLHSVIFLQTKRLNEFINELLDHPRIGADATLLAFLENPTLDASPKSTYLSI